MKLAVLGAGAWGTALGVALTRAHEAALWVRDGAQAERIVAARCNERYLPGIALPAALRVTGSLAEALDAAELILVAVPTDALRGTLAALPRSDRPVVWVCKGFERGRGLLPHQVVTEAGTVHCGGALSGPSFAQEVAAGLPAAVTFAASNAAFALDVAARLRTPRLRIYSTDDLVGVEVAGAAKNVMAIAAGISDGLGLGLNARAALVTRGLAEVTRLGLALGGRAQTFMGLAGVGDLVLTCTGDLSRNRNVGLRLARGEPLAAILEALGHVAEGVSSAREIAAIAAARGVEMPITTAVCEVLAGRVAPATAVEALLARDTKPEAEG